MSDKLQVRLMNGSERFEAARIAAICFHSRGEDPEAKRKECEESRDEHWGAFLPDGTLVGSIINNHYMMRINGQHVMCGGIGAVSTLPEYRESGAIRAIFDKLLPAARERGEVFSALYPFNHAFYRKFGYESILRGQSFKLSPQDLKPYRFSGWVKQWNKGDSLQPYLSIYERFIEGMTLSFRRDVNAIGEQHIHGQWHLDRHFCYLFGQGEEAFAYVVFDDVYHNPQAHLAVKEMAWTCREGLHACLGFLARFTADYGTICIESFPWGIDLAALLQDPYNVSTSPSRDYMLRVMNTEKALACIARDRDVQLTICIAGDEQVTENNGVFRMEGNAVTRLEEHSGADVHIDIHTLAFLCAGTVSVDTALLRGDVNCTASSVSALRSLFPPKLCWVGDHF